MSYILDALKKLEHDKSRKSRGDGMINISGALFEHERSKSSGPGGRKIALAVTVAVLMTFGATWLFLQPAKGRKMPAPRPATQLSQSPATTQATVRPAPVPPVSPVVPVQQTSPPAPATSSAPAPVTPARAPANLPKPQTANLQAAPVTDDDGEERASRRGKKERNGQAQALPADQATAAPADIKLSGIAWQEERRARRAVVNGFLMREGGVVSGATITDIFQDRVRFSLSGKSFEIPLVSSAVPAAGK